MSIDKQGNLKCDGCGKKLGENLKGRIEIVCPRCKRYNVFTSGYNSHKLLSCAIIKEEAL